MAECLLRTARILGITQAVIGALTIVLGVLELIVFQNFPPITLFILIALWAGVWILVTGCVGMRATEGEVHGASRNMYSVNEVHDGQGMQGNSRTPLKRKINCYMCLSITGSVFASIMIILYAMNIRGASYDNAHEIVSLCMVINSGCAFGAAVWAAVCCCEIINHGENPQSAPTGTVVYTQTQGPPAAYIVVQGPDGTPFAIPAQISGPMTEPGGTPVAIPAQTSGPMTEPGGRPVAIPAQTSGPMTEPGGTPVAIPAQTSGPMTEPGGTPVAIPAAVPPQCYPGSEESQSYENPVKVDL